MDFYEYDRVDPDTGAGTAVPGGTQFAAMPVQLPLPDTCNPCDQDNDGLCCHGLNQPPIGETSGCPDPPTGGCGGTCAGNDWNDMDPLCRNSCLDGDLDGSYSLSCTAFGSGCFPSDCNDNDPCMRSGGPDESCIAPDCDGKPSCKDFKDNDCDGMADGEDRNGTFQGCSFC